MHNNQSDFLAKADKLLLCGKRFLAIIY